MSWERDHEWEESKGAVKAYHNPETRGVYYVTEYEGQDGYFLAHWPNRRKDIETVTIVEPFDEEDAAVAALEETVN